MLNGRQKNSLPRKGAFRVHMVHRVHIIHHVAATVLLALALSFPARAVPLRWVKMTPEPSLEQWRVIRGEWALEDGELVGHAAPGDEAIILTAVPFADFAFTVDFHCPAPAKGGVLYRAHALPGTPIPADAEPEALELTAYGYRARIDTRDPESSGSVADWNGRGRLGETRDEAPAKVKPEGWNTLSVWAKNRKMMIKVNGKVAVKGLDDRYVNGFIGLHVDARDAAKPVEIRFRDLRGAGGERTGKWEPLFDGESLDGWREWGAEHWSVEDGVIKGVHGPKDLEGYVSTNATWADFRVRGSFKMPGGGNSGIFYHSSITLRDDGYPLIAGVQAEATPQCPGGTGWVYESYRRGWLVEPDLRMPWAFLYRPGEWNELEVECVGNRVRTWVNGAQVVDFEDDAHEFREGFLALQLHQGKDAGVFWKDLYILDPEDR